MKYCKHCNCELTPENWNSSSIKSKIYICKSCIAQYHHDRREKGKRKKQDRAKYQAERKVSLDNMNDEELVRFQYSGSPENYLVDKLDKLKYNKYKTEIESKCMGDLLHYMKEWIKPLRVAHINEAYKEAYPDRYHYKLGARDAIKQMVEHIKG